MLDGFPSLKEKTVEYLKAQWFCGNHADNESKLRIHKLLIIESDFLIVQVL